MGLSMSAYTKAAEKYGKGGFKDNKNLSFGFLTGILRVAKESIFSGMNNLAIYSVLDNKYSSYFGFILVRFLVKRMQKCTSV